MNSVYEDLQREQRQRKKTFEDLGIMDLEEEVDL